jgi:3-deoxy-manno-octulosonate cytidylyltransferase (CMP-KDO synthetase)
MLVSNVHRTANTSPLKAAAVIPSRYGAERFPGKPLHPIAGIPMVVRVLEQAQKARLVDLVLVATDDERIARAVEAAGGRAVMTDPALPSGTDRVWAAVKDLDVQVVLNVQGDEPLMDPVNVDRVAGFLLDHPEFPLATVALPIEDAAEIANPNNVKVVRADDGRALYFSRSPLPYRRRPEPGLPTLKHLGLYGYRKDALRRWTSLPPHALERAESLEQLRALAAGMAMAVLDAASDSIGVDTEEDARKVEEILLRMNMGAGASRESGPGPAAASVFTFKEKQRDPNRTTDILAVAEV